MSLVFLIGMPAVGKTFWGKKVADFLSLSFIDFDKYIETEINQSIGELIETKGESYFREVETTCLVKLIATSNENTIIACGGGAPCFNNNIDTMLKAGKVIYLQSEVYELVERMKGEPLRPLLKNTNNQKNYLDTVLQQRKGYYERATQQIDVKTITLTTFAEIISSCLQVN